MSHSWTHPWCKSPSRDEAFRAAEDNRPGPLPTLEHAISAVTERRPPEPGGGGNVTGGLRTERVTLEVTHDLDAPLGDWIVQVLDESLGYDETVRVVDNTAERITQALTADRFASAVAEADTLRARVAELESAAKLAPAANADGGSNHATPAASGEAGPGWLTADERLAVSGAILILDQQGATNIGRALDSLLNRSSPPEVVLEGFTPDAVRNLDTKYLAGWGQCMALAKRAILAAGVKVKEVGRE